MPAEASIIIKGAVDKPADTVLVHAKNINAKNERQQTAAASMSAKRMLNPSVSKKISPDSGR